MKGERERGREKRKVGEVYTHRHTETQKRSRKLRK